MCPFKEKRLAPNLAKTNVHANADKNKTVLRKVLFFKYFIV